MKTQFLRTGDFRYSIEAQPVPSLAGHCHFQISSQWLGAQNPRQDHVQLGITVDTEGLEVLIAALQQACDLLRGTASLSRRTPAEKA